ncbi:fasciclin domain-containing protein [Flagellimonas halotolerans]|uniref:Fasciclin domain-containing protein n=1 Tax=Flagellimonas halotolerans TaxID=3112164 RepID=A0ABU6ILC8_9FLAO|nr:MULTISPECIES: fasciclin domain-containing protein [unclassified Allomuricauda]MEC3963989.1 fasciclin domain-containing protein [Muricauda sp. SYSU M86414]MEC4263859.1 fasciclin domain-containing protein [Muricauda sp. SYSU M84420]
MKSLRTLTLIVSCVGFMTITTGFSQTKMVGGAPMYPSKDIVSNAVNSKDHTTLVAAVKAADLVGTLQGEGPFTVFAPTNSAFEKLPEGTVATLLKPENKSKLQSVLTYHVVAGKYNASDLMEWIEKGNGRTELTTVNGDKLTAMMGEGTIMIKDGNGNVSTVTIADVNQSNGVIHVVDTVVLPSAK